MAQHTRARMADRGCCRPSRRRGSGTVARKESRLPERNASRRLLREVLPGENRTSWPTDFLLFAQAQSVNSPAGKKSGLTVFSPVRMLQNGSTTRARQVLSIGTPDAFPP